MLGYPGRPGGKRRSVDLGIKRFVALGVSDVMAKTGKRKKKVETVFLVCEETGDYNYTLRRKTGGEKLKLSKFCPRLRKHTMHIEKKK
jgi:large subunit ribosomal protein L33